MERSTVWQGLLLAVTIAGSVPCAFGQHDATLLERCKLSDAVVAYRVTAVHLVRPSPPQFGLETPGALEWHVSVSDMEVLDCEARLVPMLPTRTISYLRSEEVGGLPIDQFRPDESIIVFLSYDPATASVQLRSVSRATDGAIAALRPLIEALKGSETERSGRLLGWALAHARSASMRSEALQYLCRTKHQSVLEPRAPARLGSYTASPTCPGRLLSNSQLLDLANEILKSRAFGLAEISMCRLLVSEHPGVVSAFLDRLSGQVSTFGDTYLQYYVALRGLCAEGSAARQSAEQLLETISGLVASGDIWPARSQLVTTGLLHLNTTPPAGPK
jgi:hypothetical protein